MTYHCANCGAALTIPSSAAWPCACPYCGTSPIDARLGQLREPLAVPALTAVSAGTAGAAQALAGELLELAHDAGRSAAA